MDKFLVDTNIIIYHLNGNPIFTVRLFAEDLFEPVIGEQIDVAFFGGHDFGGWLEDQSGGPGLIEINQH